MDLQEESGLARGTERDLTDDDERDLEAVTVNIEKGVETGRGNASVTGITLTRIPVTGPEVGTENVSEITVNVAVKTVPVFIPVLPGRQYVHVPSLQNHQRQLLLSVLNLGITMTDTVRGIVRENVNVKGLDVNRSVNGRETVKERGEKKGNLPIVVLGIKWVIFLLQGSYRTPFFLHL